MKTITLITIAILMQLASTAQIVAYDYDATGNRVKRYTITIQSSSPNEQTTLQSQQEVLADYNLTISPNPTQNDIIVSLNNAEEIPSALIELYDATGKLLYKQEKINQSNTISMSAYAMGTYYLKLSVEGVAKTWNVVKK